MPQQSRPQWKSAVFAAIASVEHALRGNHLPNQQELQKIRNFLFLQYESPLGSIVHATPLLEALKTAAPDARVTVAASSMAASVLGNNPFIDRCVVTPNPFKNFSKAVTAVRELLRTRPPGPRCVLTTIGNQRTRLAMLGLLSGNAVRVGYTLAPEMYNIPLTFAPERGQIEANLDILRALGHSAAFSEPRVFFTRQDVEFATRLLAPIPQETSATRVVFVTQNSGGQRNRWKTERFQEVIAELSQTCGAVSIFVGTSTDAGAIESLHQSSHEKGISLAGKTTIPQLAAVLAQCDVIVSLDTGTFHVARAVGLPGVVIAPAWQDPREWLPVHHPCYRVLRGPTIATAPPDYQIEEVSAEQVIAAAIDLLNRFPPSAAQRAARLQNSLRPPR